jgi:hypothetical protein
VPRTEDLDVFKELLQSGCEFVADCASVCGAGARNTRLNLTPILHQSTAHVTRQRQQLTHTHTNTSHTVC